MSETLYAAVTAAGAVERVIVVDPNGPDLQAVLAAVTPAGGSTVDVTAMTPQPGVGWTYNGTTFTAPTPPPPTAQQTARTQVQTLAATLPAHITQAQTDAATIAAMTAGQPPTAAQIAALTNHANGWVEILQALGALAAAVGVAP